MKHLLVIVLLACSFGIFAQEAERPVTPRDIEKSISKEKKDQKAIELMQAERDAKKELRNYEKELIAKDLKYQEYQRKIEEARLAKQAYISTVNPEYKALVDKKQMEKEAREMRKKERKEAKVKQKEVKKNRRGLKKEEKSKN
jgi:hypothetical protein